MTTSVVDRIPVEAHSAYARFTQSFVNCCYIVESLTPDEARGHGFTTIVTYLPSTPYDAGIGAVRIWTPNFLFLLPTSGIRIFPEHSVTCI
jgi:hypothetical protein